MSTPSRLPLPSRRQVAHRPAARRSYGEVQRRSLWCDGTIVFDDSGELLPDGRVVAPHRVTVERRPAVAV
ncbi:DUF5999 family protein [Streptomyces sp. A012304]|uniref:DUF5999 family protein n=1 Tax=Streptomyces sp. A012304 TaxID=375446 RepID=UPI0035D4247F